MVHCVCTSLGFLRREHIYDRYRCRKAKKKTLKVCSTTAAIEPVMKFVLSSLDTTRLFEFKTNKQMVRIHALARAPALARHPSIIAHYYYLC